MEFYINLYNHKKNNMGKDLKLTQKGEKALKEFEINNNLINKLIKNLKRKRPIQNIRLSKFSWWNWVEPEIRDELFKLLQNYKIKEKHGKI